MLDKIAQPSKADCLFTAGDQLCRTILSHFGTILSHFAPFLTAQVMILRQNVEDDIGSLGILHLSLFLIAALDRSQVKESRRRARALQDNPDTFGGGKRIYVALILFWPFFKYCFG